MKLLLHMDQDKSGNNRSIKSTPVIHMSKQICGKIQGRLAVSFQFSMAVHSTDSTKKIKNKMSSLSRLV